jgi:hypothetical protein
LVITNESEDLNKIFKKLIKILNQYQEEEIIYNIVIIGDDSYTNDVLRAGIKIISENSKYWKCLKFSLIPVGQPSSVQISKLISYFDVDYKNLFFSSDWTEMCDLIKNKKYVLNEEQGNMVEKKIEKYLNFENLKEMNFEISEVSITFKKYFLIFMKVIII